MAESVDALVSNTSGATRPGSTPGLGTKLKKQSLASEMLARDFFVINMEVIVTLVRLVYHDAASIRLELEVADAVKFYVLHHIWKHTLDKVGTDTSRIVFVGCHHRYKNRLKHNFVPQPVFCSSVLTSPSPCAPCRRSCG